MTGQKAPSGADVLKSVRELAAEPRGLLRGRAPLFRLIAGSIVGCVGGMTAILAVARGAAGAEGLATAALSVFFVVGGLLLGSGGLIASGAFTRGTQHALARRFEAVMRVVSWFAGWAGAAISALASALLVYGLIEQPNFAAEYPELLVNLLRLQVMALVMAQLVLLDLTPVVSSYLRPGGAQAVLRVRLAAANIAGVGVALVLAISRSSTLSDLVPAALAVTVVTTAAVQASGFRRRVEQVQREAIERFTEVVLAARRGSGVADVLAALMHLEDFLAPAGPQRTVSLVRADTDTRGLVRYLIARLADRRADNPDDGARFAVLADLDAQELVTVVEDVAVEYRESLLRGTPKRRTRRGSGTLLERPGATGADSALQKTAS